MAAQRSWPAPAATPRVSVVMPAYNAERFVGDAVRSVLRQTVADLELIVVDDGSTDGTADVVRSFPKPCIRLIRVANGGPARARNVGLAAAAPTGYVAFLDADDAWDARKLERQLDWMERHADVLALGCFMRYVSSTGRVLGRTGQEVDRGDLPRIARGEFFPFPISSLVVRRSALAAVGDFDESFRAGSEDLEFYARLAQQGVLQCVPEVLGSYRLHPESAMARDRLRINASARFARRRIAARASGGDLTWDEFSHDSRPTWRERRRDLVEVHYRRAALWHGERRPLRALWYGVLALIIDPRYTLRRIRRQRARPPSSLAGGELGQMSPD
jgi:glycosyltransferase involved in cell wall biosynthesis